MHRIQKITQLSDALHLSVLCPQEILELLIDPCGTPIIHASYQITSTQKDLIKVNRPSTPGIGNLWLRMAVSRNQAYQPYPLISAKGDIRKVIVASFTYHTAMQNEKLPQIPTYKE